MDWFFTNAPGVESMHEYETALNDLLVEHPQTTIVCHTISPGLPASMS
jgi:hypothetical protein